MCVCVAKGCPSKRGARRDAVVKRRPSDWVVLAAADQGAGKGQARSRQGTGKDHFWKVDFDFFAPGSVLQVIFACSLLVPGLLFACSLGPNGFRPLRFSYTIV